jgi:hypothetical protein
MKRTACFMVLAVVALIAALPATAQSTQSFKPNCTTSAHKKTRRFQRVL